MAEPDRSYSFRQHDEQAFNNPQQGYQAYQPYQSYRPSGDAVSPVEPSPPQQQHQQYQQASNTPPPPPSHRMHPGMHPGSSFNEMQSQRNYGPLPSQAGAAVPRRPVGPPAAAAPMEYAGAYEMGPQQRRQSFTTPGADNLSERAPGGGITGIAMGVAGAHNREGGAPGLRGIENWGRTGAGGVAGATMMPHERDQYDYGSQHGAYDPYMPDSAYHGPLHSQPSSSSFEPLARSGSGPGTGTPGAERNMYYDGRPRSTHFAPYVDDPYSNRFSASNTRLDSALAPIDPNTIEDDGDDGITPAHGQKRRSFLGLGASRPPSRGSSQGAGAPVGAAAVAGAAGAAGALSAFGRRDASGFYGPVPGNAAESSMASDHAPEKSEWLAKQSSGKKRLKWIVGIIIAVLVIGGVVAGVLLGVVFKKGGSSSNSNSSSSSSSDDNSGDLNKNSADIKALLNNKNLHKVFPGMDYTPMNAQYPECLTLPASQNNVTRDMAVLSQLTNAVRLYGTDCNQTEMVLHSIKQLGLTDMKVWLGVYLDNNETTNTRQLAQMWNILDQYGADPFKGAIIGNEVLFRKDMSVTALAGILTEAKTNMTNKNYDLPIATSDLGDNWTAQLAESVDIVMSNIHPFFAGTTAADAASWTYSFWQDHDVVVTQGLTGKTHVISETGWPSAGGNDCGSGVTCASSTSGSVAGISEMNQFMSDWVCQALTNGTQYFWFEAIDEPWKVVFNTPTQQWEDKWGLMDANRNLKKGVQIPSCNGQTVS